MKASWQTAAHQREVASGKWRDEPQVRGQCSLLTQLLQDLHPGERTPKTQKEENSHEGEGAAGV